MSCIKSLFFGITLLFHFLAINAGVIPSGNYNGKLNYNSNGGSFISSLSNSLGSFGSSIGSFGNMFSGFTGRFTGSSNSNASVTSNAVTGASAQANASLGPNGHAPVLFIHGMYSTSSAFMMIINYLASNGWDRNAMYSVDLPDKLSFGPVNAQVISSAADQLLQRTGAQKLDIVCHSMGGANTMNYILNAGGASKVRKVITLGGANKLVTSTAPSGIEVTTISSSADTIVNPTLLSRLNGANNIVINGVTHVGLLASAQVENLIKENL